VILSGVDWRVLVGGSALGAAVLCLCVTVPTDGPPLSYVRLALIALAGATAFVLDEPATAAVAAVPVPRARRTAVRLTAVLPPLATWVAGVLALAARHPGTPVVPLLVEGAGVLALALAGAAALRLSGRDEPGEVVASVLGAGMLAVLLFGSPHAVPLFPVDSGWGASTLLWSAISAAALVIVVLASVDPLSRAHAPRRRSEPPPDRAAYPGAPQEGSVPATGAAIRWERRRP
jgi:hypothetical protein